MAGIIIDSFTLKIISIGKIIVDNKTVFVISSKSPLAIALAGKQQNDVLSFNGVEYVINYIY